MPDALDVAAAVSLVVVNTIALTLLVWLVTLSLAKSLNLAIFQLFYSRFQTNKD